MWLCTNNDIALCMEYAINLVKSLTESSRIKSNTDISDAPLYTNAKYKIEVLFYNIPFLSDTQDRPISCKKSCKMSSTR